MGYEYKPRVTDVEQQKYLVFGEGIISGYLSSFLGVMSFLAVLCYLYPTYLTTPELRASYDPEFLRRALQYAMYAALGFSVLNFCLARSKRLGAVGVLFTAAAFAMTFPTCLPNADGAPAANAPAHIISGASTHTL